MTEARTPFIPAVTSARRPEESEIEARSIPRGSRTGVHYVPPDITTAEPGTLVAHSALDHLGGIDIVFNVVGGSEAPAGAFAALDDKAWRKEIDLNLKF